MNVTPLRLLCVGAVADLSDSPWGPFEPRTCADLDAASAALRERGVDALCLALAGADDAQRLLQWAALSHATLDAAVVVVAAGVTPALAQALLERGVQDVLAPADAAALGRALRLGVARKAIERAARKAYAIDLATGLPNHAQLLEHMTHLLALREREPAPMALLVLRVEGLAAVAAQLGVEAANVLRRKVAVRLRAGLRASDVVAAIGSDAYAVLLAWIDEHASSRRVADKLVGALQQPYAVAGAAASLAVAVGVADYPEQGRDAEALLRYAVGQASSLASLGPGGPARRVELGPRPAANDE
jgi:diguanylate cyclase (GGDEF)-like protein